MIPLNDLRWQHALIAEDVANGWAQVVDSVDYVLGDAVTRFEAEWAQYCEAPHAIGVANGTDAVELALRSLGVGRGDEVIVPANTFAATALAAVRAGADVRFADVDPRTLLVDPSSIEACIGPRTAAVIPVHLFGQLAAMEVIDQIAAKHGLAIVEDGAQSHGARRNDAGMGSWGGACATSFYPGKNLGAYGDGGAVTTRDNDVARRVRALGNYGSARKYEHETLGFNSRLDSLQAVVLSAKLARLEEWNDLRRAAASYYNTVLADAERVRLPVVAEGNTHVWHLYVVRVPARDQVLASLHADGILAGVHYPTPVPAQPAFGSRAPAEFPVAAEAAGEILSLPLFPGITASQQERVADTLRAAIS